ncbi:MAG: hypothetical protein HYT03_00425 [Candidatus Harrisonbacteria bacterium]|nr:hypothetical protein [Candidatus Harrisonbacteria bacterium]
MGEYSWTLTQWYSGRINPKTKIHDIEKVDWYINQFIAIIFEILMLPNDKERREIRLKDLANKF